MEKGQIIFLNGVTSAGKTSIVEEMQKYEEPFFYVLANDLMEQTVGDEHLQRDYWKHLAEVIRLMYHTARLYSEMGKNVILDGILVERAEITPHLQQLLEITSGCPLALVEVYCPLEICRQRNLERGDRYESQSAEQAQVMAKDIPYSFRVNTAENTPARCAEQIVHALFTAPRLLPGLQP